MGPTTETQARGHRASALRRSRRIRTIEFAGYGLGVTGTIARGSSDAGVGALMRVGRLAPGSAVAVALRGQWGRSGRAHERRTMCTPNELELGRRTFTCPSPRSAKLKEKQGRDRTNVVGTVEHTRGVHVPVTNWGSWQRLRTRRERHCGERQKAGRKVWGSRGRVLGSLLVGRAPPRWAVP